MNDRARAVTILDIAAEAGVSKSAVSRALTGRGEVSPEVRERVTDAARRLGYVVNTMAQGLRTRTRILGAVLRDTSRPYYGLLAAALERRAAQRDYRLVTIIGGVELSSDSAARALRTLVSLQVDGLVLSSAQLPTQELVPFVARVPVVSVGRREEVEGISSVSLDDAAAGRELAAHVVALGHRRVAVLGVDETYSLSQHLRTAAMAQTVRDAGGEVDWCPVPSDRAVRTEVARLARERQVTALMCPTDTAMLDALHELRLAGVCVPEDMSVTGFDAQPPLSAPLFGFTSFRQPVAEMGRWAVDELIDRVEAGKPPRRIVLQGELVVGRTAAPPVR